MPKYMIQASYTTEGVKGLMKDGGSQRRAAAEAALKGVGGRLESFYFAFGETDVFAIADMPDNASALAIWAAITSSGAVQLKTTPLMTPEEMDQATKKMVSYRPPGH